MEDFGLINDNFEPYPYQIIMSMGNLEKAWGLTKHEVAIQVNPKKTNKLYHNVNTSGCDVLVHLMTYWLEE